MAFSLADLQAELVALPPGASMGITHDTFADLFPPGEPDLLARRTVEVFARSNNCTIENEPADGLLYFVKAK